MLILSSLKRLMIIIVVSNDIRSVHVENKCSVAPLGVEDTDTVILGTAELVILVLIVTLVEVVVVVIVDTIIFVVDPGNCIGVPNNIFNSITIKIHNHRSSYNYHIKYTSELVRIKIIFKLLQTHVTHI